MEESYHVAQTAVDYVRAECSSRHVGTHLCKGTLPYVTEIISTSSSEGSALRARSMAIMSSTPELVSVDTL
jgi:hypothetical protein